MIQIGAENADIVSVVSAETVEIVSDYPVEFTLLRFLAGMSVTYILLAITVFIAVWLPARQAMGIQPAEALHEE